MQEALKCFNAVLMDPLPPAPDDGERDATLRGCLSGSGRRLDCRQASIFHFSSSIPSAARSNLFFFNGGAASPSLSGPYPSMSSTTGIFPFPFLATYLDDSLPCNFSSVPSQANGHNCIFFAILT